MAWLGLWFALSLGEKHQFERKTEKNEGKNALTNEEGKEK